MLSPIDRDQIAGVPIFAGVRADHLEELTAAATRVELAPGQMLFADDDPADAFFVVLSGAIEVFLGGPQGGDRVLARVGPGMVIGEISLLIGGRRSTSARAAEPSVLSRVPYEELRELIRTESPSAYRVVYNLAQVLATRLRAVDDHLADLCKGDEAAAASTDDLDRLRRIFFVDWR